MYLTVLIKRTYGVLHSGGCINRGGAYLASVGIHMPVMIGGCTLCLEQLKPRSCWRNRREVGSDELGLCARSIHFLGP